MKSLDLQTEDQKKVFWKSFDRQRWLFLNYSTRVFRQALKKQLEPVLKYIREEGLEEADAFIQQAVTAEPIRAAFDIVYVRVGSHFGEQIFESLSEKSMKQQDDFTRAVRRYVALQAADRVDGITLTSKANMIDKLTRGINQGQGIDKIASRMAESVGGVTRATRIARTEIISASNLGSLEGARATGLNPGKVWISTRDGRTRGSDPKDQFDHVSPDGQTTETLDDFFIVSGEQMLFPGDYSNGASLGNLINCFTGDTEVSFDSCKKSIRSSYSGKLITIQTSSGFKLTGTPNHPVMTDSGFIRLDEVDHLTNLVCCPLNRKITSNLDVNNVPVPFKKLHNLFSVFSATRMRMVNVVVNLYGRSPNSKVDIVDVNSFLWNNVMSVLLKFFHKKTFMITNFTKSFLFCFSAFNLNLRKMFFREVFGGLMSRFNLLLSFLFSHLIPFKLFSFGLSPNMNTGISQSLSNHISTDTKLFSDSVFAHTRRVQRNNFLGIDRGSVFSSSIPPLSKSLEDQSLANPVMISDFKPRLSRFVHLDNPVLIESKFVHDVDVFTLETNEGIYNAGGIIASNCRCTQGYSTR